MYSLHVLSYYIVWHYTKAWLDFLNIARNFLWFFYNFFSIPLLLKTLFSPWKRLSQDDSHKSSFGERLIVDFLMRIAGFFIRFFTVFLGVLSLVGVFIFTLLAALFWLLAPFIVAILLITGIGILFQ